MSNENKVQIEWVQCCVAYKPRNIGGQTPIRWKVDPVLFGKRYHEERTKQRLSHEQVREKIMDMTGEDVSVSYLQEIEQGKCNSREWCHYLAKVFDVCPEYFAGVVDFRWITREKAHNSVYPEKQTEEKLIKAISFEDKLRKSLTKKYILHRENPEIEKRIGYAVYKLTKENEKLFRLLYEVASDSNSRAQFQTIMMRNYQYKEWND